MKKNLLKSVLLCIGLSFVNISYSQCNYLDYDLEVSGFGCGNDEGTICLITSIDWAQPWTVCDDYVAELEFPTGNFIYTDLLDFFLHSSNQTTTILRHEINISTFTAPSGCLKGLIQVPGTEFILRIVNPNSPFDIVSEQTFIFDDHTSVGNPLQKTVLSEAIANGDLLPVNEAQTTSQRVTLEGNLIVDVDYAFGSSPNSMRNEILMGANAKITITSGHTLTVSRTNITSCDLPWDRILVSDGAIFNARIFNNISKANTAIDCSAGSTLRLGPATNISECSLGIRSTGEFSIRRIGFSTISNCFKGAHFANSGTLMITNDASGFNGQLSFSSIATDGMYLGNTGLIADNLFFSNCGSNGISSASVEKILDLNECTFSNCFTGVSTSGNTELTVRESEFQSSNNGIIKYAGLPEQNTLIENNFFSACNTDIFGFVLPSRGRIQFNEFNFNTGDNILLNGLGAGEHIWAVQHNPVISSSGGRGINVAFQAIRNGRIFKNGFLNSSGRSNVSIGGGEKNYVGYNPLLGATLGLALGSCPKSQLYCNDIQSQNTSMGILNLCSGSDIRGNTMSSQSYNLSYGTPRNTFGHTGEQPYKGNVFDPSSEANPKAIHHTGFLAQQDQYLLGFNAGAKGSALFPFFTSSFPFWFTRDETGSEDYECPPGKPSPTQDESVAVLRSAINTNVFLLENETLQELGSEVEFDLKLKALRSLEELNELESLDEENIYWYNMLSNDSEVGTLISFEKAFGNAIEFSKEEKAEIEALTGSLETALNQLRSLETEEWEGDESVLDNIDWDENQDLRQTILSLETELSVIYVEKQNQINGLIPAISGINNSVPESTLLSVNNIKKTNQLLLKRLQGVSFTETEIQELDDIANQCVGVGGEGVYTARSLLAEFNLNKTDYDDECIGGEQELRVGGHTENFTVLKSMQITPNPVDDNLNISLPSNVELNEVAIVNLLGKVYFSQKINPDQSNISINVLNIPNGIYFVRLDNETVKMNKIIIQH